MKFIITSPIRSGSTLVYNIIKKIFTNKQIIKLHSFLYNPEWFYFITIRHPYNSIISTLLKNTSKKDNKRFSKKNLNLAINEYIKSMNTFLLKTDFNNVIILKYEKFHENYDYIFDRLQRKLNIIIVNREQIIEDLSINNVKKYINDFNKKNNLEEDFKNYDKTTHFHSNHISKYNGKTDYKKILKNQPELLNILKSNSMLNMFIKKFKY
jgi:tRNA G10  N-methylase Trm11